MNNTRDLLFGEVCLLTISMGMFGLFIQSVFPYTLISIAGLVCVCAVITFRLVKNINKSFTALLAFFGIKPFTKKTLLYTILCLLTGLVLGGIFRIFFNVSFFPGTITLFALSVAPLIGISEELLFRGYIQHRLYKVHGLLAVILAALSHTLYKCSLMVFPPLFNKAKIPYLAFWTFFGGILFGLLSKKSNSVYPALAGHAVFDIIVYSACETAPWWVW